MSYGSSFGKSQTMAVQNQSGEETARNFSSCLHPTNCWPLTSTEGPTFQKGVPKLLFRLPGPRNPLPMFYNYDVSKNGQRFLFNKVSESSEPPTVNVISNWRALLK